MGKRGPLPKKIKVCCPRCYGIGVIIDRFDHGWFFDCPLCHGKKKILILKYGPENSSTRFSADEQAGTGLQMPPGPQESKERLPDGAVEVGEDGQPPGPSSRLWASRSSTGHSLTSPRHQIKIEGIMDQSAASRYGVEDE